MQIDNSRANAFRLCPWYYYENYVRGGRGVELIKAKGGDYSPLELGSRGHELMEEFYKRVEPGSIYLPKEGPLEAEAQWIMQEYAARYPNDAFEVLDVERTFRVRLPNFCPKCYAHEGQDEYHGDVVHCTKCGEPQMYMHQRHTAIGKIDLFVRALKTFDEFTEGGLYIIDHKFEKRGAKSNHPQKWAASDQASLYLWIAEAIYKEPISNFVVNICTRPSPAGRERPTFNRQKLERSPVDLEIAVRDLVIVADEIERYTQTFKDGVWPANRQECYGWGACDYYLLHRYGEDVTEILKHKYEPRGEYLFLDGVQVIQPNN